MPVEEHKELRDLVSQTLQSKGVLQKVQVSFNFIDFAVLNVFTKFNLFFLYIFRLKYGLVCS